MTAIHTLILAAATIATALCAPQSAVAQQAALVDRVVAIVNDDVITQVELERRTTQVLRQLERRPGAQPPPRDELERQVLERLILERAQMQLANERGIRITDAQLDLAVERFARDNGLTVEQLRDRVQGEGMTLGTFRDQLRGEIVRARLREREVDSRIVVSEADVDAWLAQNRGRPAGADPTVEYEVAQILLRVGENAPDDEVARSRERATQLVRELREGADFARLATEHSDLPGGADSASLGWRDASRLPQIFVDAVRGLEPGAVAEPVRSPNGFHVLKLLGRRDAAGQGGDAPVAQTHVRHILIQPDELVPEAEVLRRLRDIRQRVLAGDARFEDMARQYSSDGSAGRGGDLGWVYPGDTVPEFERAMNALAPDEISEPVRTPFGFHLIQVLGRRTDQASPERIRQVARQAVREQRAEEAYEIWAQQLRDSAYVVIRPE